MRNRIVQWPRRRRGVTIVETAVVAPLVLTATFGAMLVGYAFMARQTVTLAAREGARTGVLPGSTVTDVQARVDQTMSGLGLAGYTATIDMGSSTDPNVTVTVSLPFDRTTITAGFFTGTMDIASTSIMRRELAGLTPIAGP